eukprot:115156_1
MMIILMSLLFSVTLYLNAVTAQDEECCPATWEHVITAGCDSILTHMQYIGDPENCWKGYSDSEINELMTSSREMKIEFSNVPTADLDYSTLYVQLVDGISPETTTSVRDFSYYPDPNGAKWKWNECDDYLYGPCSHSLQTQYGYFFFFKTMDREGPCAPGDFEHTISGKSKTEIRGGYDGFQNRDSGNDGIFFPLIGWNSDIKIYAKTRENKCTDEPTMDPSVAPSTDKPTMDPSVAPSTDEPTMYPSVAPINPSLSPSFAPTDESVDIESVESSDESESGSGNGSDENSESESGSDSDENLFFVANKASKISNHISNDNKEEKDEYQMVIEINPTMFEYLVVMVALVSFFVLILICCWYGKTDVNNQETSVESQIV